jgi:multidrug efflux pump subunit AcrA (membrane-fusion protein)
MKHTLLLFAFAGLAACSKPATEVGHERPAENGAQFKDREGVALTETMKKAIGLQVAEVEEAKVAPRFTIPLHVLPEASGFQKIALSSTSRTASGWLTNAEAAHVKPGLPVSLQIGADSVAAVVKIVEKSPYHVSGEFEVTVEAEKPLEVGTRVLATFRGEAGEASAAIPRSALLKTAEGAFVYAVNGERYVRTPVKLGAENDDLVEIADGLYSGDQVVTRGVMPLWLAELQVLRGGKACTCGH